MLAASLIFASTTVAQNAVDLISSLDFPGKRVTDVTSYVDIFSQIEYAIVGHSSSSNQGIAIVDLSDPELPQIVSTLDGPPGFDLKVFDTFVYTVTGGGDGGTNQGAIIDISNPLAPVRVAGFPSSHNIFIDKKGFMYAESPGLIIYDLNINPLAPVEVWRDGLSGGHDATAIGDTLYDFHGSSGTTIYDVSDRANPIELGHISAPFVAYHHSGWATTDGQFLFVNDELSSHPAADVTIWDISDPSNPELAGSISDSLATVHNLQIIGDLAFFSYYSAGFKVYNISNPVEPVLIGEYDTDPAATPGFSGAFGVDAFLPSGLVLVSGAAASPSPGQLHILNVQGFTTVGTGPVPEASASSLEIMTYPNPVVDQLTVSFESRGTSEISIHNILGKQLMHQVVAGDGSHSEISLDSSSLPAGVYYLKVRNGSIANTKSFTVIR